MIPVTTLGRRSRRSCLALAGSALAVTLAIAGCQSAEQKFRKQQLRPLRTQLATEKAQIAATLRTVPAHNDKAAQPLRSEIETLGATVNRLAAVKPPASATGQFQRYRQAYAALVESLRNFVAALVHGKRAALTQAGQLSRDAAGAAQRADDDLQAALTRGGR